MERGGTSLHSTPDPKSNPFAQARIREVQIALSKARLPFGARAAQPMPLDAYPFKEEPKDYNVYWDVRKGLIPIVGGARETGDPFVSILCTFSIFFHEILILEISFLLEFDPISSV